MKIQVQIYLPDQNQGTVWGYGTITLDQLLTFQIRIFDMRKRSRNQGGVCQFSQKKAGRTMGGLGNRGGFTTKPDHRGSPGSNPDGNHKRFVSSPN